MSWSISCFSSFLFIKVCFRVSNEAWHRLVASPSHCLVIESDRSIPLRQVYRLAPLLKRYNTISLLSNACYWQPYTIILHILFAYSIRNTSYLIQMTEPVMRSPPRLPYCAMAYPASLFSLVSTPFCHISCFSSLKLRYQISINSLCHKFFLYRVGREKLTKRLL